MNLTKKSLEILKSFRQKQNIQSVADKFNTTYDIIRNNYFKHFWRTGYLIRIGKGYYVISGKGHFTIKKARLSNKIDSLIIKKAKKGTTNEEIINLIDEKYHTKLTNPSIYSKIYRFRKEHNLIDRNRVVTHLPEKFTPELAELLGLIFSDGYVHKHYVSFYNKSEALISRFQVLISKLFKLRNVQIRIKAKETTEILYNSMDLSNFINNFFRNKTTLPNQVLNGSKEIKTAFLRGYFSGDGGVCLSITYKKAKGKFELFPFVFVACERTNITKLLAQILESLGFRYLYNDTGIRIGRMEYLIKFHKEISFVEHCTITQHSKNWKNFEKNQLLRYVVSSLRKDNTLKEMTYNGTKEQIVKYIQSKLSKM